MMLLRLRVMGSGNTDLSWQQNRCKGYRIHEAIMASANISGWKNVVRGESGALIKKAQGLDTQGINWEYRGDGFGRGILWFGSVPRLKQPRCGAKTRAGEPCQAKAVKGSERCRLHGGLSTGPKTAAGRAKIAESNQCRRQRVDQLMQEIQQMQSTKQMRSGLTPKTQT